jgi:hypothetical protein
MVQAARKDSDGAARVAERGRGRGCPSLAAGGWSAESRRRDRLVALATREAVPAMYEQREFTAAGGLMSYGTSLAANSRPMSTSERCSRVPSQPRRRPAVPTERSEAALAQCRRVLGWFLNRGLVGCRGSGTAAPLSRSRSTQLLAALCRLWWGLPRRPKARADAEDTFREIVPGAWWRRSWAAPTGLW